MNSRQSGLFGILRCIYLGVLVSSFNFITQAAVLTLQNGIPGSINLSGYFRIAKIVVPEGQSSLVVEITDYDAVYNFSPGSSLNGPYRTYTSIGQAPTSKQHLASSSYGGLTLKDTPETPLRGGDYYFLVEASENYYVTISYQITATYSVYPPTITRIPDGGKIALGGTWTFRGGATGKGLRYQWRKDGVTIQGANAEFLTINNARIADGGNYELVVTNEGGERSASAALTVIEPPRIIAQPQSQRAAERSSVTFSVVATGTDLTYQWRKGGTPLTRATGPQLVLGNLIPGDSADYTVDIRNSAGFATSDKATLAVISKPYIEQQPQSKTVSEGENALFSVRARNGTLSYQWRKNGYDLAGETGVSLNVFNARRSAEGSLYSVEVKNEFFTVSSSSAILHVDVPSVPRPPNVLEEPEGKEVWEEEEVVLFARFGGTPPITLQWLKDGQEIPGENAATLTLNPTTPDDTGSYTLTARNGLGTAQTRAASVTVKPLPATPIITAQPRSQEVVEGRIAEFSVDGFGKKPLTYQWFRDGAELAGETQSILRLPPQPLGATGTVSVVVSTQQGSTRSQDASILIIPKPGSAFRSQVMVFPKLDEPKIAVSQNGEIFLVARGDAGAAIDGQTVLTNSGTVAAYLSRRGNLLWSRAFYNNPSLQSSLHSVGTFATGGGYFVEQLFEGNEKTRTGSSNTTVIRSLTATGEVSHESKRIEKVWQGRFTFPSGGFRGFRTATGSSVPMLKSAAHNQMIGIAKYPQSEDTGTYPNSPRTPLYMVFQMNQAHEQTWESVASASVSMKKGAKPQPFPVDIISDLSNNSYALFNSGEVEMRDPVGTVGWLSNPLGHGTFLKAALDTDLNIWVLGTGTNQTLFLTKSGAVYDLLWRAETAKTNRNHYARAVDLALDEKNNAYVLGDYFGLVALDPETTLKADVRSTFIASYSPKGTARWAMDFGGGNQSARGISIDSNGDTLVLGSYSNTLTLGGLTLSGTGNGCYLARLTTNLPPPNIIDISVVENFGAVRIGTSTQETLTIANNGTSPLSVVSISYPAGFSGGWSGSIAAGASQDVAVTFSPTSLTDIGGTVLVNSDATQGRITTTVMGTPELPVSGNVALEGELDFGGVNVGSSATRVLTIVNDSLKVVKVTRILYPPGFSGTWAGPIVPGTSKSVTVKFAPTEVGSYGGNVTLVSDNLIGTAPLTISGTGLPKPTRIIMLQGDLAFGDVPVGATAHRTMYIFNEGNSPLTVTGIWCPATFSASWAGLIPAGGFQAVGVQFQPKPGSSTSRELTVSSDATASIPARKPPSWSKTAVVAGLLVSGRSAPVLSLSGNLAFGVVTLGTTAQTSLVISNQGLSAIKVTRITYPTGFSGPATAEILPHRSISLVVSFKPTVAKAYTGQIRVSSASSNGTPAISVSGLATPKATKIIALSGSTVFGNVIMGNSVQKSLIITNKGNATLTISGITYPNGFSGKDVTGEIAAGGSKTLVITFAPTAIRSYSGSLRIDTDATGTKTRSLSGKGVGKPGETRIIALSGSMAFGNLAVGKSAQRSLIITNRGNSTLTITGITYPAGYGGEDATGPITAGSSKIIQVTFSPTAIKSYTGSLRVLSDASGTSTRSLSGRGTAAALTAFAAAPEDSPQPDADVPELEINLNGSTLLIQWQSGTDWKLQRCADLSHGEWLDVDVAPSSSSYTELVLKMRAFFRLVR